MHKFVHYICFIGIWEERKKNKNKNSYVWKRINETISFQIRPTKIEFLALGVQGCVWTMHDILGFNRFPYHMHLISMGKPMLHGR